MSETSQALVRALVERLRRVGRRQQLAEGAWGAILLLGILAGAWLLAAGIESRFWMDPSVRRAIVGGMVLLWLAVAALVLFRPLLRFLGWVSGPPDDQLARQIGSRFPEISDRLVNLLQLVEGRSSPTSPALLDHAVTTLGRHIEPVPFEQAVTFDRARRASRWAVAPVAGVLLFLLAAPGAVRGASQRLLAPGTHFDRPAPFRLTVTPGDVELARGDSLAIVGHAVGEELPEQAFLDIQHLNEALVVSETLRPDSSHRFEHRLHNLRQSFRYRFRAGAVTSAWFTATIVERPIVRSLQASLDFPRYSRIPPQRLDPNVGDVQALAGTIVSLDIALGGQDIVAGVVERNDGRRDTLTVDGLGASGRFTLRSDGTYRLLFTDANGRSNDDPIEYTMRVVPDAYPGVLLLEPAPVAELGETLSASLRMRLTDDFGFSRLALFYRLAESRFGAPAETFSVFPLLDPAPNELDQERLLDWYLRRDTPIDPVPGDVIEYYVEVWDNDTVAGFKSARSALHQLRLPSIAEQFEMLDETENEAEEQLEEMLDEARQMREQFQELRDELRTTQENDWEDQRQLEQLREQQSTLEQRVEDIHQSFEEMIERMEQNDLASDRTMEMYEELQKVVEEIDSPELREALEQLQEAMQELNLQHMQDALQNYEFNETQYQQRLERTLELFKELRVQQDLEEAARRAEDLAEQQEEIREKTGELMDEPPAPEDRSPEPGERTEQRPEDPPEDESSTEPGETQPEDTPSEPNESTDTPQEQLAQQQELSSEEMKQLEQLLEQIQERMDELKQAPSEEMQQLQQQVRQEQLPQQMQQNAEQLRQQQIQSAQQQQQQMQQQLQQMQQQLQQMQQGMQGEQMQINVAALRRVLSDILTLSQDQERLINAVRDLSPDSPALRQLAQAQVELGEGAAVVSDSLQRLARDIPQMTRQVQQEAGEALRSMALATESMAERITGQAEAHQKGAMMHLNELALLLSDLLNQMMNMQSSGSGSGMSLQQMINQLQNAAQQQQQLNQQIQQMLNEMQGNRLSQEMQDRLRQMAAQQEAIRSQVKNLSRNPELRGKLTGDLDKIAEQMEETIQELQRGQTGRRTQERQQQILTRLLDATRSMQERGREERREGRISDMPFPREGPSNLPPSEEAETLRRALIDALESGYSPDYEVLIRRYFELLQRSTTTPP